VCVRRLFAVIGLAVLVPAFVGLGFWQLDRLDDRRGFNRRLLSRGAHPIAPVVRVAFEPDAAYRRVSAAGTYDTANEIVVGPRSYRGLSGYHVITPLRLDDGRAVVVDRGWVPLQLRDPPIEEGLPPSGSVAIEGVLVPSEERKRFGPQEEQGRRESLFRVDIPRLQDQLPYEVLPLYLLLERQSPAQPSEHPRPVDLPSLDEGPHLAYAIQWFLFAIGVVVGAVVIATRRPRSRQSVVDPPRS
jgi:surfeit locus 1 family protein